MKQNLDTSPEEIGTFEKPNCMLCGSIGEVLHSNVTDRLFSAPGSWTLKTCTNKKCGLAWLDPMPKTEDLDKLYKTYYTHSNPAPKCAEAVSEKMKPQPTETPKPSFIARCYDTVIRGYMANHYGYTHLSHGFLDRLFGYLMYMHPGRRADADWNAMQLPYKKDGSLLEIGCGSGFTLETLQKYGWDAQGIDFDESAIQAASQRGINVKLGGLFEQQYSDDQFDAIIMSHVIEHLPDPVETLLECLRILKPGGLLVSYTPNIKSIGHSWYRQNWRGLEPPRHLYLYSVDSLSNLHKKAGFDKVTSEFSGKARFVLLQSRRLKLGVPENQSRKLGWLLWAEIMELAEWVFHFFNKNIGEEIVVKAHKSMESDK